MTAFTLCPEYVFSRTSQRQAVNTPGDGYRKSRQLADRERRAWTLQWVDASHDVVEYIETLYAETYGGVLSMTYTPPEESSAINVRFGPDPLEIEYTNKAKASVDVTLVETLL